MLLFPILQKGQVAGPRSQMMKTRFKFNPSDTKSYSNSLCSHLLLSLDVGSEQEVNDWILVPALTLTCYVPIPQVELQLLYLRNEKVELNDL